MTNYRYRRHMVIRVVVFSGVGFALANTLRFHLGRFVLGKLHSPFAAGVTMQLLVILALYLSVGLAVEELKKLFWRVLIVAVPLSGIAEGMDRLVRVKGVGWAAKLGSFLPLALMAIVGSVLLSSLKWNRAAAVKGGVIAAAVSVIPSFVADIFSLYDGFWKWVMVNVTWGVLSGALMGVAIVLGSLTDRRGLEDGEAETKKKALVTDDLPS